MAILSSSTLSFMGHEPSLPVVILVTRPLAVFLPIFTTILRGQTFVSPKKI